jgi:predicted HTH transcriptional regulator
MEDDLVIISDLIGQTNLESAEVEFKRQLEREKTENWLKTVAGFSNAEGGTLYVGVEDGTHRLIGFGREKADAVSAASYHSTPSRTPSVSGTSSK